MLRNANRNLLIGAFASLVLVVALAGCSGEDSTSTSSSTTGAQQAVSGEGATAETGMRTVTVYPEQPKDPSPSATELHAGIEKGKLPAGETVATVMTDEDCAPDAQGVSHCRNVVRLPSGKTIALRHPHEMHSVPCLEPGEKVLLRKA